MAADQSSMASKRKRELKADEKNDKNLGLAVKKSMLPPQSEGLKSVGEGDIGMSQ